MAVYVRNVSRAPTRAAAIEALARKTVEAGSTLLLAPDTVPLSEHALKMGWIAPAAVPQVAEARAADAAPPTPLEQLLGQGEKAPGPSVVVEHPAPDADTLKEALKAGDQRTEKPPAVEVKGEGQGDNDAKAEKQLRNTGEH